MSSMISNRMAGKRMTIRGLGASPDPGYPFSPWPWQSTGERHQSKGTQTGYGYFTFYEHNKSSGHHSEGHHSSGHKSTGHKSPGHKSSGHKSPGHKSPGHKSPDHHSKGGSDSHSHGDWYSGKLDYMPKKKRPHRKRRLKRRIRFRRRYGY